jgi:hypothetical protein
MRFVLVLRLLCSAIYGKTQMVSSALSGIDAILDSDDRWAGVARAAWVSLRERVAWSSRELLAADAIKG